MHFNIMRKVLYPTIAVAIALLAHIVFQWLGPRPWIVDGTKEFNDGLRNSLYYLDMAKRQWVWEKNKTDQDVPTLNDLTPYLGSNLDSIKRFQALGVRYTITSRATNQSDVATLTHDLLFGRGYGPFCSAGIRYCIHTGWLSPQSKLASRPFLLLYIENNLDHWLEEALAILVVANLLLLVIKKRRSKPDGASLLL